VWGVILSEAKDLRDPSALRPQGDMWGVILSEAKDLRGGPSLTLRATKKDRAQGFGSWASKKGEVLRLSENWGEKDFSNSLKKYLTKLILIHIILIYEAKNSISSR